MNWFVTKLKHLADMKSGDLISSEAIDPQGDYPVYGGGSLRGFTNKYTHEGKLILIGRQGAHCGAVRKVNGKIYASEHAIVVTKKTNIDNEWLFYLLDSMNLNQYSISAAQPGLSVNMLKNLEVKIPSYDSQVSIRRFINNRIEKFEKIILNKELLIALLEQQRQSIITEAVTKGLNPNVKMKDSGVEWIGEIPEHWVLKKIKYCVELQTKKAEDNSKLQYIGLENIESKTGQFITSTQTEIDGSAIEFRKNSVLFSKLRPYLTKVLLADFDGRCTTEILVMKPLKTILEKNYLKYILLSPNFIDEVNSSTYGSKMPRANWDFIGNTYIPIPPNSEQKIIETKILGYEKEYFEVRNKLNLQIEKLKEYRQSLIYEAVTGKIDVSEMELEEVR